MAGKGPSSPISGLRVSSIDRETGPGASLRAGRKRDATPEIAVPIADKARQIKELDTRSNSRVAGRRSAGLREAAGRLWVGISHRSLMGDSCQKRTPLMLTK
jgi:hypothetical protein